MIQRDSMLNIVKAYPLIGLPEYGIAWKKFNSVSMAVISAPQQNR